jgi:sugar lactone lactonase YvrE
MKSVLTAALALVLACAASAQAPADDLATVTKRATAAYEAKNYAAFRDAMLRATELAPDRPRVWYNVACAYALTGEPERAVRWLDRIAAAGLMVPAADDTDFATIAKTVPFQAVLARLAANGTPVRSAERVITLPERGLVAEGLAYDPVDRCFYVSSVRKRKVLRVDAKGRVADFVAGRDELWSALGIAVDASRRRLWVTTAAMPQTLGLAPGDEGRSALLRYDLATGRLDLSVALANTPTRHALADLAVAANGDVYVTDSLTPALYRLREGATALERLELSARLESPQGLALTSDGRRLYLADYSSGVLVVDLATLVATHLAHPDDVCLVGIDGLALTGGALYATQNGVRPKRVVRVALDGAGARATRLDVLEAGTPELGEPTLGTVVDGWFYFNADSGWDAFDARGTFPPEATLRPNTVLRVRL